MAIKTLQEAFSADPERVARFEREAQALGALNHPYIAQIYGVSEGPPALIMELVPGESPAERLIAGPVPLHEPLHPCHARNVFVHPSTERVVGYFE